MSDRHAGYVVVLDEDLHEDDTEPVVSALGMIRGVLAVVPVKADISMEVAAARAESEVRRKLLDMLAEHSRGRRSG